MARKRELLNFYHNLLKAQNRADQMNRENPKKLASELDEIARSVIARWYGSYEPLIYRRQSGLYDVFRVQRNGTFIKVMFNADWISGSHRADNTTIYENSFKNGYHGGASQGDGHPEPGVPYWRTPVGIYSEWGHPAYRSFSPFEQMREEMTQYAHTFKQDAQRKFETTVLNPLWRSLNGVLRK